MKIYLDVCCLNRPFDDYTINRVRLESEAVLTILSQAGIKNWLLLHSEVIDIEISKIPDSDRKNKVLILSSMLREKSTINDDIQKRAIELEKLGFKPFDALHLACAEKGKADIFLTTDDELLRRAFQKKNILKVKLENPVKWLMEVI